MEKEEEKKKNKFSEKISMRPMFSVPALSTINLSIRVAMSSDSVVYVLFKPCHLIKN